MLAHRLRRWPNIEAALGKWPVFAGILAINLLAAEGETSPVFAYKNGESSSSYSKYCRLIFSQHTDMQYEGMPEDNDNIIQACVWLHIFNDSYRIFYIYNYAENISNLI